MLSNPAQIDRLIERQGHLWELRRRVAEEGGKEARAHLAHHPEGPWMTISSQLGSAGRTLADGVAARLGLRIRVVAPIETRIAAVMRSAQVDEESARRRIEQDDRSRSDFIRQVYRREITDGDGYDLVFNSGAVDMESATEIVLLALSRKLA